MSLPCSKSFSYSIAGKVLNLYYKTPSAPVMPHSLENTFPYAGPSVKTLQTIFV